ncbi:hypothetical protein N7540_005094 [Penicillium herquei]|nr:hypothetical protein N7540_005094 [Penicillium herquei]
MAEDSRCIACGWSMEEQKCCSYESHVKLFYGASQRGTWSIGSDVILKDRPDEGPKTEVTTLKFLTNYPKIPVPKVLRDWVDSDGRYFVLTERMKGQTLEKVWSSLSETQKISITDEVIAIRRNLRSITSDAIQGVDRNAANIGLLFFDSGPHGPFHSDTELWDALSISLQSSVKELLPKEVLDNMKKRMPQCEPYVLTHCDLNLGNIIVQDGKLVGILDWEYAAFLPVWHEYVSASWGWTDDDLEWKKLLQERMRVHGDGHEDARGFWRALRSLRQYPELDEQGRELFEKLQVCAED